MNLTKKLLIVFAIILQTTLTASAYDVKVDGILYDVISEENQTLEVYSAPFVSGEITIPSVISYKKTLYGYWYRRRSFLLLSRPYLDSNSEFGDEYW